MTDFFLDEGRLTPGHAAVAIIVVGDEERYLMQLRDQKADIFYPGHWGLFGGAADSDESLEQTLRRELREELNLEAKKMSYFTNFSFDFRFCGMRPFNRSFYEVIIDSAAMADFTLGEGSEMRLFSAREILTAPRVVPFDAFAIWLHAQGRRVLKPQMT